MSLKAESTVVIGFLGERASAHGPQIWLYPVLSLPAISGQNAGAGDN